MEPLRAVSLNTLKRPAPPSVDDKPYARQRVLLTPPASSDGPAASDDVPFKVPALPQHVRLMTPSSSTIAASSSPGPVSSPMRKSGLSKSKSGPIIHIELRDGLTYAFGRHRTADPSRPRPKEIPQDIASQLFDSREADPTHQIYLPRTASHASRLHLVMQFSSASGSIRLVNIGQNGTRIRSKALRRRVVQGDCVEFKPEQDEQVKLDFYGCVALLQTPSRPVEEEKEEEEEAASNSLFSPSSSPVRLNLASLPPSSPPLELEAEPETHSRSSSPLSPVSEKITLEDDIRVKTEAMAEALALEHIIPSSPIAAAPARPVSRAASPVHEIPPIPADIDLPALIASTVVFSGSSKLSQPDLVKHLLESQPSFRNTASEEAWNAWVGEELESNEMFGKVSRVGKDSSGHPLLPHYFYNPERDPDVSRAQELGGLVRPLRTVQRAGGKAIDWRPVGGGRRRY